MLEERLQEVGSNLVEEEEKVKSLGKLKNKYEAIIADLEAMLKREQQVRKYLFKKLVWIPNLTPRHYSSALSELSHAIMAYMCYLESQCLCDILSWQF